MGKQYKQPWLYKPSIEWLFILLPPFFCLLFVICFPALFKAGNEMPDYWWVILILLVDVGHVYSTLYRTYLNPLAWRKYRQPMQWIPVFALLLFVVIYSMSATAFWVVLAYLAVFHFVRQQYGIFQLYSRKEERNDWERKIDVVTIYAATLYPLLYWHFSGDRAFNWFVEGDFFIGYMPQLLPVLGVLYCLVLTAYCLKEIYYSIKRKKVNVPKNTVALGTILSWYLGIVYFNGDMAFTLFNVISHGIPYMALIWMYVQRENSDSNPARSKPFYKIFFSHFGLPLFIISLALLAYVEEGLWDAMLWKEHTSVFGIFSNFNDVIKGSVWLNFLIPLLALPQIVHYIIDGFIWRQQKTIG